MNLEQLTAQDAKAIVWQVQSMLVNRGYAEGTLPQAAGALLLVHGMAILDCYQHDPHILKLLTEELSDTVSYVLQHLREYNEQGRACLNETLS